MRFEIHRDLIRTDGLINESLMNALGLGDWVEPSAREYDQKAVRRDLRRLHNAAELEAVMIKAPVILRANIERLKSLVGLSDLDCQILEFAVLIRTERLFDDTADLLGPLATAKVSQVLAILLDRHEAEVRAALSARGLLARSGLLTVNSRDTTTLRAKIDLLSDKLADSLVASAIDPVTSIRDIVAPAAAPTLKLANYDHMTEDVRILLSYLECALQARRRGVNIYLHGPPGTGKTELVRVLAAARSCQLFEVASEDGDGDPISGESRLRAFRAAQCFFSGQMTLILFDEVDDVFSGEDYERSGRTSIAHKRKAWVNRILEGNPVPTLWLSNSIQGIDPAFLRRFDMVVEVPVPNRQQRAGIIRDTCGEFLPDDWIGATSRSAALSPGVVTRAASVVSAIRNSLPAEDAPRAFTWIINNTLRAQGHPRIARHDPNELPPVYDPAFIHADTNLLKLAAGLKHARIGRLCLYGPSGTGKTAFARWLAERIGVNLCVRRASDLFSPYFGASERNIAEAFAEAAQDQSLLLIDEIESFLRDRRDAQRSWEVSLVNEMLTQIESYSGVLVGTTNLVDGLDPAAMRRFDLKVKFDYLKGSQAAELFRRHSRQLGFDDPNGHELATVSRMGLLTPGDFAAVVRRHAFDPISNPGEFIDALQAQAAIKNGPKRSIGF